MDQDEPLCSKSALDQPTAIDSCPWMHLHAGWMSRLGWFALGSYAFAVRARSRYRQFHLQLLPTRRQTRLLNTMKRKISPVKANQPAKKARPDVPAYHLTPPHREQDGSIRWPAPQTQMEKARQMIIAWYVALGVFFICICFIPFSTLTFRRCCMYP